MRNHFDRTYSMECNFKNEKIDKIFLDRIVEIWGAEIPNKNTRYI